MVREASRYEELRYALRSLANLPHDRVWVYGGRPDWLSDKATHVRVPQGRVAHANTARITAAIAGNRGLSQQWLWFHDDMFILAPITDVPRLYRCPWPEWEAASPQRRGPYGEAKTKATVEALAAAGKTPRYCYELHIPMAVDRDAFAGMVADVTARRPDALTLVQKRSLYGNWVGYGGVQATDVKFRRPGKVELPGGGFASSSDASFQFSTAGAAIRDLFPEPGPYERTPHRTAVPDAVRLMAGHLGVR